MAQSHTSARLPMLIARLQAVGMSYGTHSIFSGLDLSLNDGDKIGLVGPNGAGKSSLLRLIAGIEPPAAGERTLRRDIVVAYLPQEYGEGVHATAYEEVVAGRPDLRALADDLHAIEATIADAARAADMQAMERALARQLALIEAYDAAGGDRLATDAHGLLERLGLPPDLHDATLATLSGGQRKMVGLARCLIAKPDLLLLDEPDNHLDLAGKALLESVLQSYPGALILISHDRYLLDDTIREVAELADGRLTRYTGNYSSYATQRELALLRQQQDYVAQQKEIQRLEAAIVRFKEWASLVVDERHKKQANNKQRQLDQMDKVDRPVLERRTMGLRLVSSVRGGQKVLEARHLSRLFDERIVLCDVNFTLMRGDRVGLVGRNGSGKSVLFRCLLGLDAPTEGDVWVGPSIQTGYYAQQHDTLDPAETPLHLVRGLRPMREQEAMGLLGRFLFTYRQAQGPIANLSGGEKSRLQLARLMIGGANFLMLDEPTNHLDIASTEVLEDALNAFDGTLLTISHDRYFLDRVCTRIFALEDGDLQEYPGGYTDYATEKARRALPPPALPTPLAPTRAKPPPSRRK